MPKEQDKGSRNAAQCKIIAFFTLWMKNLTPRL
jgi:hypothetical protein